MGRVVAFAAHAALFSGTLGIGVLALRVVAAPGHEPARNERVDTSRAALRPVIAPPGAGGEMMLFVVATAEQKGALEAALAAERDVAGLAGEGARVAWVAVADVDADVALLAQVVADDNASSAAWGAARVIDVRRLYGRLAVGLR